MCVYSMVMDTWKPVFSGYCITCGQPLGTGVHICPMGPAPTVTAPSIPTPFTTTIVSDPIALAQLRKDVDDLKKKIEGFEICKRAAELVDELTKQKDCVDPEKAKLLETVEQLKAQVAVLERAVAAIPPAPPNPKKKSKNSN